MLRDRRPLALQVRDEIRDLIDREGLRPGDQLPTEVEVANRFGVARTTVREALKLLEQGGLIDVRHGLGRFVSGLPTLERPVTRLESVTEMMDGLGYRVTNKVLDVTIRAAANDEAVALSLPAAAQVIHLERLRLQGEKPLIYSVDVFRRDLIDGDIEAIEWSGSLLRELEAQGHRIASATAEIKAVLLPQAIVERVGLAAQPWLLMVHTNLDERGRPVIYSHDYYRGDGFTFNVLRRRSD